MRITAGLAGGRILKVPARIRPTQDRVREAYFSKMASMIEGCRFLDLYAGSGSVGMESVSRGAAQAVLVELDRTSFRTMQDNIGLLGMSAVSAVCSDVFRYLAAGSKLRFNLIYADPPYELADVEGFAGKILGLIRAGGWLSEDGVFTLEHRTGGAPEVPPEWSLLDSRRYGQSQLDFYVQKDVAGCAEKKL